MFFLFFIFSFLGIISAILVVSSRNPVHSVLFLILTFCSSSALLLLLEVEFLAMLFLVVYIGAIAVLFLFVVMMLNVKVIELTEGVFKYFPISILIGFIFLIEILLMINNSDHFLNIETSFFNTNVFIQIQNSNISQISDLLFNSFFFAFLLSSLILLVAMIGSIVLTLNQKIIIRRQNIYNQIRRNVNTSLDLVSLKLLLKK